MSQPSARVLLDSISDDEFRLTTMEVTCHRFVLAEFNTHRKFSRNSASSRAIPLHKQIEKVKNDPAIPLVWASEQKGMSGGEPLDDDQAARAEAMWLSARDSAAFRAQEMSYLGVHKSLCNRLLEPFMWHTIIVSSTEWENFFVQRCSSLAQPEIRVAAEEMRDALNASTPKLTLDWHMPLIREADWGDVSRLFNVSLREDIVPIMTKISAARCARVSYLTHEGVRDVEQDVDRYNRLVAAQPPHASPLEHVATPGFNKPGNFDGWQQLRHIVLPAVA